MDIYDYYITDEEYLQATKNGVSGHTLEIRIRELGWNKSKAINTPPKVHKTYPKKIKELATQNGISIATLGMRVNKFGWDMYTAATKPLQDKKTQSKIAAEKCRKYPKEYVEKAKANGISASVFRQRISQHGWSLEDAATIPIMTGDEIVLMSKVSRLAMEVLF